jgi:cytochrome c
MKLRHILLLAIGTLLLAACNQTLAADVTPPPGYVAPSPVPTMGPLYPEQAPDLANGEVIYVEKCAPCHGDTGLGNGPQSKDLPVSVIPIGLPEFANDATPSRWYTVVTQGNIERFMPPFVSLSDQERWDVVSYALMLQTTEEQVELGKTLFEENCADCAEAFSNSK